MSATTHQKNRMLETLAGCTISLHTGDGGETGANELSGDGYGRQACPLDVAARSGIGTHSPVVFTDLPAATVTHYGAWMGGAFLWSVPLVTPIPTTRGASIEFSAGSINFQAT